MWKWKGFGEHHYTRIVILWGHDHFGIFPLPVPRSHINLLQKFKMTKANKNIVQWVIFVYQLEIEL